MVGATLIFVFLPVLVSCSGDGNVHILEEEIAQSLKACLSPGVKDGVGGNSQRPKREEYGTEDQYGGDISHRIDGEGQPLYVQEKSNASEMLEQIHVLNSTENNVNEGWKEGERFISASGNSRLGRGSLYKRLKRSDPLLDKDNNDQCLSQCIFANLQVVDARGIPREAELWNKVMISVTSQQSRAVLHDQVRACFQELQSEAEDNGCSYSNKLERCLMLRFSDRKINSTQLNAEQKS